MGITLNWNRLFVIGFALVILFGTLLVMAKTPVGLQLRAVMQNRRMAASLGIRTARMNGFTFAFGSGLAGLGGAFLSQLGNVGPSMGQSYIVDSFMIVTVGGVGNIVGASLSALGIGSVDQMLQPLLGPVMGKITTLLAIILLLQWRPGGIFPSRSRSLEG
jgi:urea transport system permease protein